MTNEAFPNILNNPPKLLKQLKTKPERYWTRRGEIHALTLFHQMAKRVPAYHDFLKKHGIHENTIHTIRDFQQIPTVDKNNYLRSYPMESLCWDGKLKEQSWTIAVTSGSTGEPFYFPRTRQQDLQYAATAELYLLNNFHIDTTSTLYIIGFPMGAWIGGVFTFAALNILQNRGYPLTVISPGINKPEIIKAVKNLGPHFDQVIIGSYAPFLKDIIDDAKEYGVDWKKYNVRFVFSAEGFSETFRDYVIKNTGLPDPYTTTLNHYGTVDMGTMAHETPLSILLRRLSLTDKKIYKTLFSESNKLPTLTQYLPELFYFESVDGTLLCSARSGLPLVRYDLKDHGGVRSLTSLTQLLEQIGIHLDRETRRADIDKTIWNLPFAYVYERTDLSVSFFAFQIYPETIRKALQGKEYDKVITGKFTMVVSYDMKANPQLIIHIELRPGSHESNILRKSLTEDIILQLTGDSSEYRRTRESYPLQTTPLLKFWSYEHPTHFRPGGKQKWVKK